MSSNKPSPPPKNPRRNHSTASAHKSHPTSWEPVEKWYKQAVGEEGHYFHKQIVLPGILRLFKFSDENSALLDLACGQGILAKHLPEKVHYFGIDISPSLIKEAKKSDANPLHQYAVADVTKALPIKNATFSHAAIVLALQNIEHPSQVFANARKYLRPDGKLLIVLNHPCFRIPRQSSWQIDENKKIQYRRLDRYFSSMNIPIQAHPSKGEKSPETISFHHPLSTYSSWLKDNGFVIELIEEWCSDKTSTGGAAKMENRSREEFPMFLTILAKMDR